MKPETKAETKGAGAGRWWEVADFCRGLELLNTGHYFDAHEQLEDVWRGLQGPERLFLQALIQVAVALHHHSTGNFEGAHSVMARAAVNLAPYLDGFGNIEVSTLNSDIESWLKALSEHRSEMPPLTVTVTS